MNLNIPVRSFRGSAGRIGAGRDHYKLTAACWPGQISVQDPASIGRNKMIVSSDTVPEPMEGQGIQGPVIL